MLIGHRCSQSEAWLDDLSRCYQRHLTELNPHAPRVKIAILDTGYDGKDSVIQDEKHRIQQAISKVENGNVSVDRVGHGTHALALLLKVAPFADVYVIQLANSKTLPKKDWIRVEEVIYQSSQYIQCPFAKPMTLGHRGRRG